MTTWCSSKIKFSELYNALELNLKFYCGEFGGAKKKFEVNLSDFKKIPYVGDATQSDLLALGYTDIASLKDADADEMFERTKALGRGSDRCILYVYRMVCYYANTPHPDKAKLKWWRWKD